MNTPIRRHSRPLFCLILCAGALLMGCEGQKIVARVNTEPILEEEFHERTTHVTAGEFPPGTSFDAGGIALLGMITEKIKTQYAAEKGWLPSREEVSRTVAYLKRSNPLLRSAIQTGRFTDRDVERRVRDTMIDFAIGTNGAKADEKKLQDLYRQRIPNLTVPESWIVQILPVNDPSSGQKVLEELKRTGDFKAAARLAGIPPQHAVNAGQETPIPVKNVDAATKAELDRLAPGKFTDKPIKLTLTNPSQSATVVLKMIGREKEYVPSLEDVKFLLTQELISQTQPQWQSFRNQQLAEATSRADIQINIKRYAYLLDIIRAQAMENARGMVPGASTPPPGGSATRTPVPSSPGSSR